MGRRGRDDRGGELFAFDNHHRHIVFTAGAIGGGDQFRNCRFRISGVTFHRGANLGGRHLIAEPVAAQQQRAIRLEREALHLDEVGVVGRVLLAAHVAKHFVAPRMPHRIRFAQLAAVLALTHRRMIVRDLANFAAPHLVKPRIADVPGHRGAVLQHDQGEHAGHALPLRVGARRPQDFVVGHRDGLAYALLGSAGLALQARANALHRKRRRLFPRGLAADAIHHQEDAALLIDVEGVLVVTADASGIARTRAPDFGLNHSLCFGIPGRRRPRARCARAPAPAPPNCGRVFRRYRIRCWKAPSRR